MNGGMGSWEEGGDGRETFLSSQSTIPPVPHSPMRLSIIAAVSLNGVIGRDGRLPWHLPADLRHFKSLTVGKTVIMGRKTFDSLPGLLEGRRHIVLTRDRDWAEEGAEVVHLANLLERMDAVAKEEGSSCYVEILAKNGVRVPRPIEAGRELLALDTAPHSHEEAND